MLPPLLWSNNYTIRYLHFNWIDNDLICTSSNYHINKASSAYSMGSRYRFLSIGNDDNNAWWHLYSVVPAWTPLLQTILFLSLLQYVPLTLPRLLHLILNERILPLNRYVVLALQRLRLVVMRILLLLPYFLLSSTHSSPISFIYSNEFAYCVELPLAFLPSCGEWRKMENRKRTCNIPSSTTHKLDDFSNSPSLFFVHFTFISTLRKQPAWRNGRNYSSKIFGNLEWNYPWNKI